MFFFFQFGQIQQKWVTFVDNKFYIIQPYICILLNWEGSMFFVFFSCTLKMDCKLLQSCWQLFDHFNNNNFIWVADGAVVCNATSQQEDRGFNPRPANFLCGVCVSSPCLCGSLPPCPDWARLKFTWKHTMSTYSSVYPLWYCLDSLDEKPWYVQLELRPLWLYASMVTV